MQDKFRALLEAVRGIAHAHDSSATWCRLAAAQALVDSHAEQCPMVGCDWTHPHIHKLQP
jgi:hypothetical protein